MGKPPRQPDEGTRIGRPRVYDSAADKLDAFRQRQASAGYLRREVLVTEEVAERLAELARQHGVSAGDVGSAMVEFGLEHYDAQGALASAEAAVQPPAPVPMASAAAGSAMPKRAAMAMSAPVESPPPVQAASAPPREDPIRAFFKRRKGA
ncbi:hypothetical protein BH10PSE17_BH10PSE17_18830 [soil metagenome]